MRIWLLIFLLLGFAPALSWAEVISTQAQPKKVTNQIKPVHEKATKPIKHHSASATHTQSKHKKVSHSKTKLHKKKHVAKKHSNTKKTALKSKKFKPNTPESPSKRTRAVQTASEADDDDDAVSSHVEIPRIESAATNHSSMSMSEKANGVGLKTQQLLNYAGSFLGAQYRFGGSSPTTGFDCSGYVSYVYRNAAGIYLPHNAAAISRVGMRISRDELRPGDLVFFRHLRKSIGHVGIYMGNDRFIHASSSATGYVEISNLHERYWARTFQGARRLMASNDSYSMR